MFRKFAYQFAGNEGPEGFGEWGESWIPPWAERRGRNAPPHITHTVHMRRGGGMGPFGHGGRGPLGHGGQDMFTHGEGGRFFGRGDMKFALLELLRERPMYGYEMIKTLEERSSGFYSPSPGSIYPTLQMLEERGFVTSQDVESKKVYSITDDGRNLLEKQQEQFANAPWSRFRRAHEERHGGSRLEMQALRRESLEVARLFTMAARSSFSDPAKLARLRAVIEHTRKELNDMIYGEPSHDAPPPSTDAE